MRVVCQYALLSLCLTFLLMSCKEHNPWPPETNGPNLPVRYCDITEEDKDEALIGYVFVDTSAVNWILPNLMKGSRIYTPELSDLRKAELILQQEYPSILGQAYDKDGHLFEEGGLRNYARQYVFLQDPKGKRYVYVNFVLMKIADLEDKEPPYRDPTDSIPPPPPERDALSRSVIFVLDGGDAYWQALLELDNDKVLWFSINGLA